jgi:hypothetical protein
LKLAEGIHPVLSLRLSMGKTLHFIEEPNLVCALKSTHAALDPISGKPHRIKVFTAASLTVAREATANWTYTELVEPVMAMALIRRFVCLAVGTAAETRIIKLCLCERRSVPLHEESWSTAASLADRLAALPTWPQRDGPYGGNLRVLNPQGYLRYPFRAGGSFRRPYPSFLQANCGLGTA